MLIFYESFIYKTNIELNIKKTFNIIKKLQVIIAKIN